MDEGGLTTRSADPAAPPEPEVRRARRVGWLLFAAATFVLGLFVGGVIVGFADDSSGPVVRTVTRTVTPSAVPNPGGAGSGAATGQAVVSAQCLRAVNEAQTVAGQLGSVIDALRSFNLSAVNDGIRALQPLQARLRRDAAACQVSTSLGGASSVPLSPTPAPSPS
jgi:hypothetical protein